MPRPRRCQVREDQQHSWIVAGEQFICAVCKEPGPDINEVLRLIWDIRGPRKGSAIDRAAFLHDVLVPRAQNVLFEFENAAAVLEAELAAEGDLPPPTPPPPAPEFRLLARLTPWWVHLTDPADPIPGIVPFVCEEHALDFLQRNFPTAERLPAKVHVSSAGRECWIIAVRLTPAKTGKP